MKILVTGVGGQLGYDVCKVLNARQIENRGVDLADFDITDAQATHDYIAAYRPDAVIHCSAWTAVMVEMILERSAWTEVWKRRSICRSHVA